MSQEYEITFFVDRSLGKHTVPEILRATGINVEIHDDHFSQQTLDVEWIPEIGEQDWIILTKDARIATNRHERQAVAYAGLKMFAFASQNLSGEAMAIAFQKALPKMLKFIDESTAPFIAKVYKDGKVIEEA
ncbi:MAG: hypothetical protein J7647_26770 [Cyanobacteria bacterium SBLK]|nr:hypothetical protein [Cyanobacteria bacterium SBLK]